MPNDVSMWLTLSAGAAGGAVLTGFFNYLNARIKAANDSVQMQSAAIYKVQMEMASAYLTATKEGEKLIGSVLEGNSSLSTEEVILKLKESKEKILKSYALAPIYFSSSVQSAIADDAGCWINALEFTIEYVTGKMGEDETTKTDFIYKGQGGWYSSHILLVRALKAELLPASEIARQEKQPHQYNVPTQPKRMFKLSFSRKRKSSNSG